MFNLPAGSSLILPTGGGGGGPTSYIESVQAVQITIGTGAASATASITSVDTANAFILWGGFTTTNDSSNGTVIFPRIELTNATTVTAYRGSSSGSDTVTVRATVIEFKAAAIVSVQQGTVGLTGSQTSNTATISSVTTSRAALFYLGHTTSAANANGVSQMEAITLTNATTVTAARNTGSGIHTVGFVVVEFDASVIQSVQPKAVTLTSNTTSDTSSITSVNTANSFIAYNGVVPTNNNYTMFCYNLSLTGSTTVTLTRSGTNISSRVIRFTVIEFKSGVLASIQRGSTVLSAANSNSSSITGVSSTKSAVVMTGFLTNASSHDELFPTVKLASTTSVTAQKNTNASLSTPAWEVLEFV